MLTWYFTEVHAREAGVVIAKLSSGGRVPGSALARSLRKRPMTIFFPFILIFAYLAIGALAATYIFAPCGDTPGFCPYATVISLQR
jgi:hypothetical protein